MQWKREIQHAGSNKWGFTSLNVLEFVDVTEKSSATHPPAHLIQEEA